MNDTDAAAAAAAFRARNMLVLRWKDGAMDGSDGWTKTRAWRHTRTRSRENVMSFTTVRARGEHVGCAMTKD